MSEQSIGLQPGASPETVLAAEDPAIVAAARSAASVEDAAAIVRLAPRSLLAWATLGDLSGDDVSRYAAYRVGYHRGLDALRASGWRGASRVRAVHPENEPFLRCLRGLGRMAAAIGESDEHERITTFLAMLDPRG